MTLLLDDSMIVMTSGGEPVDVDEESLALSASRAFMEIIESARAEIKAGKTLSLDEMKRAVLP